MEENIIKNETTDKKFCTVCGTEISQEAVLCPSCGAAQDKVINSQEELKGFKKIIHKFKTDKKLWIICGGILAAILIVTVVSVAMYRTSLRYYWNMVNEEYPGIDCGLGSDYILIDTNMFDLDPDDMTYVQSSMYYRNYEKTLDAVQFLNSELGFDSDVYEDMLETNSLMGRQSVYNDKYRISWTYHPSKGLEVKYEKR